MTVARVIVVRHAKSDYPGGVSDHDRPLNDRGRRDAPAAGRWLEENVVWPDGAAPLVLVSSAHRAQLTWSLAREALSDRWREATVRDDPRIYEADVSALRALLVEAAPDASPPATILLVGHNPGLAGLIDELALSEPATWEATAKFPTSAIAVLASGLPLEQALAHDHGFRVSAFAVPRG